MLSPGVKDASGPDSNQVEAASECSVFWSRPQPEHLFFGNSFANRAHSPQPVATLSLSVLVRCCRWTGSGLVTKDCLQHDGVVQLAARSSIILPKAFHRPPTIVGSTDAVLRLGRVIPFICRRSTARAALRAGTRKYYVFMAAAAAAVTAAQSNS
jgi:hypothetical protein